MLTKVKEQLDDHGKEALAAYLALIENFAPFMVSGVTATLQGAASTHKTDISSIEYRTEVSELIYQTMYDRIPKVIQEKDVLEIATGPGLLAKHVAYAANKMIATDYSEGMIAEARKGKYPANLTFEVADATDLPFDDSSFDVVLIANALHVMSDPEKALMEIKRVLKDKGILIAPN